MGETALMVNPAAFAFSGGGSTDREGLPCRGADWGLGGTEGGREGGLFTFMYKFDAFILVA